MNEDSRASTPLEQKWKDTQIEVESASGLVRVTMTGDHRLQIWIDPTWYARTSVDQLQSELTNAARLVYVERTRAYYATWSGLAGFRIGPARTALTPKQAEYRHQLEQVEARGTACSTSIEVTLIGSSNFSVRLDPQALHELDAPAFCSYLESAAMACLREHEVGWQRAHFDVFTRPKLERAGLL